jgi:hypothetical protein
MPSKDEGNNKAVLAALVLMPLSLSLASSIAILYKCARSYGTS